MADLGVSSVAQNCLNFMQFFRNFWQNRMLVPPEGLAPPTGNPGSTPEAERSHRLLSLGAACVLVKLCIFKPFFHFYHFYVKNQRLQTKMRRETYNRTDEAFHRSSIEGQKMLHFRF